MTTAHHEAVCDLMAENGRLTAALAERDAVIEKLVEALAAFLEETEDTDNRDANGWWSLTVHKSDVTTARAALAAARAVKGE